MSRLDFTIRAQQDLDQILEFIARDNPAAGLSFVARLRESCHTLSTQPLMGQPRPEFASGKCRCFPFQGYVIYYEPLSDGIVVVRVLHGMRDHDALL